MIWRDTSMEKQFKPDKAQLHALLKKSIVTGFFGGMIWSLIWLIAYGLNIIRLDPALFWDKFFWGNLPFDRWYMYLVMILLYSTLSILFAVVYYILFKRFSHWIVGLFYGVILWALLLFAVPLLVNRQTILVHYPHETVVGLCCLGILYGIFIGYTISFNYQILRYDEEVKG